MAKIVTITHSPEGIRLNRGGVIALYSNAVYMAEALAHAMEEADSLRSKLKDIAECVELNQSSQSLSSQELHGRLINELREILGTDCPF